MAIKLVAARKHRAARLACCSMPFMASTKEGLHKPPGHVLGADLIA